jgi:hypothetical protein
MEQENLELRRNGTYTCIDCKKTKSKECDECKNWGKFDLDKTLFDLTYQEKLKSKKLE